MKSILSAFLMICAFSANAQDIRWLLDQSQIGDYAVYRDRHSEPLIIVLTQRKGDNYIFQSYRGTSTQSSPVSRVKTDNEGNWLESYDRDGKVVRYRPHNCRRVVGRCEYTATLSDGRRIGYAVETTPTRQGYKFIQFRDGVELESGNVILRENGWAGNDRIVQRGKVYTRKLRKLVVQ